MHRHKLSLHVAVVNRASREEVLVPLLDDCHGGFACGAAAADSYGHTPLSYALLYYKPDDPAKSAASRRDARKTVALLREAAQPPRNIKASGKWQMGDSK